MFSRYSEYWISNKDPEIQKVHIIIFYSGVEALQKRKKILRKKSLFMNGFPMGENRNIVVSINFKLIVKIFKEVQRQETYSY